MLKVTGLCAGYGDTEILRGIDIAAGPGEIIAVLGPNGAGKTTLNNVLSGILAPASGSIRFDGEDIAGAPAAELVARGLVHVPEGRRVFPNLSVLETWNWGATVAGASAGPKTWSALFLFSPACGSACRKTPALCPEENSKCWLLGAV